MLLINEAGFSKGQKQVVTDFNSFIFNTGELANTLRKSIQALFTSSEQGAVAFLEQVLKQGTFSTKDEKQTFKRSIQRAVVALYNNRKGLDITRNNVVLRDVKADEKIDTRGKIVDIKKPSDKPSDKPSESFTEKIDNLQTIENLKASVAKADDTIDTLQSENDQHITTQNNMADEIDAKDALIAELKSEIERLKKDVSLTYEKYHVVVDAINSNITRKELRALVS